MKIMEYVFCTRPKPLCKMELLSVKDEALFKLLVNNLSLRTTDAKFSKMAFDKKHKQARKNKKRFHQFS